MTPAILWMLMGPGNLTPPSPDPWWGVDKAWHLTVSHTLTNLLHAHGGVSCGQAVSITVGVGMLKEWVDRRFRGTGFSWRDLFWDAVGAVMGCLAPPR